MFKGLVTDDAGLARKRDMVTLISFAEQRLGGEVDEMK